MSSTLIALYRAGRMLAAARRPRWAMARSPARGREAGRLHWFAISRRASGGFLVTGMFAIPYKGEGRKPLPILAAQVRPTPGSHPKPGRRVDGPPRSQPQPLNERGELQRRIVRALPATRPPSRRAHKPQYDVFVRWTKLPNADLYTRAVRTRRDSVLFLPSKLNFQNDGRDRPQSGAGL